MAYTKMHPGQIAFVRDIHGPAPLLGRLLDWGLGPTTSWIVDPLAGRGRAVVKRCAEIVAEEPARGADEPDPPADY
jgi:hypothetical protein